MAASSFECHFEMLRILKIGGRAGPTMHMSFHLVIFLDFVFPAEVLADVTRLRLSRAPSLPVVYCLLMGSTLDTRTGAVCGG